MKKRGIVALLSILFSFLTIVAIGFFWIPGFNPVSEWDISKIVKQQIVQEKINETSRVTNLESDVTNALDKALPSVVTISSRVPNINNDTVLTQGEASGIIITKDGYILTNKHVVTSENTNYIVTNQDGTVYFVDEIWSDPNIDIAIIHVTTQSGTVPTDLTPANFVSYKAGIRVGQFVLSLGNVDGQNETSATLGIISAVNRNITNPPTDDLYRGLYQTDAALHEWNSWWPLINVAGEVIWVATAKKGIEVDIGYAIPLTSEYITATLGSMNDYRSIISWDNINISWVDLRQLAPWLREKLEQSELTGARPRTSIIPFPLETNGITHYTIPRPSFWAELLNLSKEKAIQNEYSKFEGYYVNSVLPGTPAEKAGLLTWDIIVDIDNMPVNKSIGFFYALDAHRAWDKITLTVFRNKEYKSVEVMTDIVFWRSAIR